MKFNRLISQPDKRMSEARVSISERSAYRKNSPAQSLIRLPFNFSKTLPKLAKSTKIEQLFASGEVDGYVVFVRIGFLQFHSIGGVSLTSFGEMNMFL